MIVNSQTSQLAVNPAEPVAGGATHKWGQAASPTRSRHI